MTTQSSVDDNTFTLVIWENVPETTDFYLIPNSIAEKYRTNFEGAHNKFINSNEMNNDMEILNLAFGERDEEQLANKWYDEHAGALLRFKRANTTPITGVVITQVYLTGFVM